MKLTLQVTDLNNRVRLFKDVSALTGGSSGKLDFVPTRASGSIVFLSNPAAAQTITLNGVVWTFVAAGATGTQTNIAGTLALTLAQLVIDLNASGNGSISVATYSTDGIDTLSVKYDNGSLASNAYTLAASAATPSGANLTGGMDAGTASTFGGTFCACVIGGTLSVYRLVSGTNGGADSPSKVRPVDYDAVLHQRYWEFTNITGTVGGFLALSGGSLTGAINEAKGADIASATTTDIGAATGNFVHVTGTVTITGLGTVQAGTRRIVEFTGILTLTHNGTSLILPTGANITTAAGDVAMFVSEGSGNWRCVLYMPAAGYLRLDGGTLTGALIGTTATFTGLVSGQNFKPTSSSLTYSGTPAVDMAGDGEKFITMTGDITSMTTTNRAVGKKVTVTLDANGSIRNIAPNASWKAVGTAMPATLASGKFGVLTLWFPLAAAAETDCFYAFQPTL